MKATKTLMGMHVTVEIADPTAKEEDLKSVFEYFQYVDNAFSTYKKTSEISLINSKKLSPSEYSQDMKKILKLSEKTKKETNGFFNILHQGKLDPSGIVKGWAIWEASKLLKKRGIHNFFIDAGGDIQVQGQFSPNKPWSIGIRNPFNKEQIVKVVILKNKGIATSGTAERGQHVYNPHKAKQSLNEIVSISVIGPNIYEADRFATAAFAMERKGIEFIERLKGFEGYMIDKNGIATFTSGFNKFIKPDIIT